MDVIGSRFRPGCGNARDDGPFSAVSPHCGRGAYLSRNIGGPRHLHDRRWRTISDTVGRDARAGSGGTCLLLLGSRVGGHWCWAAAAVMVAVGLVFGLLRALRPGGASLGSNVSSTYEGEIVGERLYRALSSLASAAVSSLFLSRCSKSLRRRAASNRANSGSRRKMARTIS